MVIAAAPCKKGEEVRIHPWMDHVTIGLGPVGVIRWGWWNCTHGLTDDWVHATDHHYRLIFEGQVIQEIDAKKVTKHWGESFELNGRVEYCIWPARTTWVAYWEYDKLKLEKPGEYQLEVYIAIREPLIDGFDLDEDGQADWYEGVFYNKVITIEVVD